MASTTLTITLRWTSLKGGEVRQANWGIGEGISGMEHRQPLSIVAIFGKDFTDADVNSAQAGLMKLGFDRNLFTPSLPPKLSVGLDPDADQEEIQKVATFLEGVEHVDILRSVIRVGTRIARERVLGSAMYKGTLARSRTADRS